MKDVTEAPAKEVKEAEDVIMADPVLPATEAEAIAAEAKGEQATKASQPSEAGHGQLGVLAGFLNKTSRCSGCFWSWGLAIICNTRAGWGLATLCNTIFGSALLTLFGLFLVLGACNYLQHQGQMGACNLCSTIFGSALLGLSVVDGVFFKYSSSFGLSMQAW